MSRVDGNDFGIPRQVQAGQDEGRRRGRGRLSLRGYDGGRRRFVVTTTLARVARDQPCDCEMYRCVYMCVCGAGKVVCGCVWLCENKRGCGKSNEHHVAPYPALSSLRDCDSLLSTASVLVNPSNCLLQRHDRTYYCSTKMRLQRRSRAYSEGRSQAALLGSR
jgi:hypothetical protein